MNKKAKSKVYIWKNALYVIKDEVSLQDGVETGGLLIGIKLKNNNFLITHSTKAGPKSTRKHSLFKRDPLFAKLKLDKLHCSYGVDYLGEWHSHPGGQLNPSHLDLKTMDVIIKDKKNYNLEQVLLLLSSSKEIFNFKIYHINKLVVEIVEVKVVGRPEEIAKRHAFFKNDN